MLEPSHPILDLLRRDPRFRLDAYVFVFEALRFAQQELGLGQGDSGVAADDDEDESSISGEEDDEPIGGEVHHVSGQQLCEAIRRYALQQYGPLARNVLSHWGVRSTDDFGEIVFNLIDIGQMKKTDTDRREDFHNVFDFDEGLREAFEPAEPAPRKGRRP